MGSMEGMSGMSGHSMEGMSHGTDAAMAGSGGAMASASEHMACFYTARAAIVIGIIIGLIGIGIILANKVSIRRMVAVALAVTGIAVILTPLVFYPTCKSPEMFCNQGAKQLLIVLGGMTLLAGGWLAFAPQRRTDTVAKTAMETA
jgi:uncharacterized membrane protein YkgB